MPLSRAFNNGPRPVPPQASEMSTVKPEKATTCTITERSVDEARRLRVVIIGAGVSGIISCVRFLQRIPNVDLCIYEKNEDVGGTWFENRYPGCACGKLQSLGF